MVNISTTIGNSNFLVFAKNNNLYLKKSPKNELGEILLKNEIKEIKKINKSTFINFFEYNESSNNSYIIMNYKGRSLRNLMQTRKLNIPMLDLLIGIIDELNSFGSNFIHGDIKPENIMIYNNKIQLIDFGTSNLKSHYYHSYTSNYVNKQLIENDISNFNTDLYSLGITFFEIINYYSSNSTKINCLLIENINNTINNMISEDNGKYFTSWDEVKRIILQSMNSSFVKSKENLVHNYNYSTYEKYTSCFTGSEYPAFKFYQNHHKTNGEIQFVHINCTSSEHI